MSKPRATLPLGDVSFDSDGQFRVSGCNPTTDDKHEIANRANAYPLLIEALRNAADGLAARGGMENAEHCRRLLRELGEL